MALCVLCIFVAKIGTISISKMWPYFHNNFQDYNR